MMKRVLKAFVVLLALFLTPSCSGNPFEPTPYELVSLVSVDPDNSTIRLGQEQVFTISSKKEELDEIDISFFVDEATVEDPQCRCKKSVQLGRLSRPEPDKLVYYAPLSITEQVALPLTLKIYVGAGRSKDDPYSSYRKNRKDVATITLIP